MYYTCDYNTNVSQTVQDENIIVGGESPTRSITIADFKFQI